MNKLRVLAGCEHLGCAVCHMSSVHVNVESLSQLHRCLSHVYSVPEMLDTAPMSVNCCGARVHSGFRTNSNQKKEKTALLSVIKEKLMANLSFPLTAITFEAWQVSYSLAHNRHDYARRRVRAKKCRF